MQFIHIIKGIIFHKKVVKYFKEVSTLAKDIFYFLFVKDFYELLWQNHPNFEKGHFLANEINHVSFLKNYNYPLRVYSKIYLVTNATTTSPSENAPVYGRTVNCMDIYTMVPISILYQ